MQGSDLKIPLQWVCPALSAHAIPYCLKICKQHFWWTSAAFLPGCIRLIHQVRKEIFQSLLWKYLQWRCCKVLVCRQNDNWQQPGLHWLHRRRPVWLLSENPCARIFHRLLWQSFALFLLKYFCCIQFMAPLIVSNRCFKRKNKTSVWNNQAISHALTLFSLHFMKFSP